METAKTRDSVLLKDVTRLRARLRTKCDLLSRDLLLSCHSRKVYVPPPPKLEVSIHIQPKLCNDVSIGTDTEWKPTTTDLLPKRKSVPVIELNTTIVSPTKPTSTVTRYIRRLGTSQYGRRSQLNSRDVPHRRRYRSSLEDLQALCIRKDLSLLHSSRNKSDYHPRPSQTNYRYRRRKMTSRSEQQFNLELVGQEVPIAL